MAYSLPTIDLKISSFNTPNINVDVLSKFFIYGPTDTHVHPPPPLLNPSAFKPASNSDILPLLYRITSNSTESSLGIPPLVLKKCAKELCFFDSSLSQGILPSSWRDIHITPLPKMQQSAHASHKFRPIAATPTGLKICERFILGQIQPFLEKSNDQNQFA